MASPLVASLPNHAGGTVPARAGVDYITCKTRTILGEALSLALELH